MERRGKHRYEEEVEHSVVETKRKPSLFSRILGVIGELLITAGLLIGLFIVWQVWWTDIEANREQAKVLDQLEETYGGTVTIDDGIADPQEGPPPEWDRTPGVGETMGIMRIPAFGEDYKYTLVYGTDMASILDTGAFGQYEDTALPGEVGNFSTAAHRQTYGAPMRDVADLDMGDKIIVELPEAFLVYSIVDEEIVLPSAVRTIAPDPFAAREAAAAGTEVTADPTRRLLTITTCHPPFISNERWVVHAEFEYWTDRADGLPIDLVNEEDRPAEAEGAN